MNILIAAAASIVATFFPNEQINADPVQVTSW